MNEGFDFYGNSPPMCMLPKYRAALLDACSSIEDRPSPISASHPIYTNGENSPLQLFGCTSSSKDTSSIDQLSREGSVSVDSCPSRPFAISAHHFFVNNANYKEVKASIDKLLSEWSDFDCSYFPMEYCVSS